MFAPRITAIAGADFTDDLNRSPGAGWWLPPRWRVQGKQPMTVHDGAMIPTENRNPSFGGDYEGQGMAQWTSNFEGDQFVEIEVSDVSVTDINTSSSGDSHIEIYTHGAANLACMVAEILYSVTDQRIFWWLYQYGPNGEFIDYGGGDGEIDPATTGGHFPEPETWRVESDLAGEQRLYRNGHLLATVTAPNPAAGSRIGLFTRSERPSTGWPDTNPTSPRSGTIRVDRFSGGLLAPLGTEELGLWVRIGVDHQTLGNQWFFRGFVDELVPTYDPEHQDAVRIECIDSLGEAGRVEVDGGRLAEPVRHGAHPDPSDPGPRLLAEAFPQPVRGRHHPLPPGDAARPSTC